MTLNTSLGNLVREIFERYMTEYGDDELASIATAATIDELLCSDARRRSAANARRRAPGVRPDLAGPARTAA